MAETTTGASVATTSTDPRTSTESTLAQKLSAEAIGTGVLVLLGCGSAVVFATASGIEDTAPFVPTASTVGLAFGLTVAFLVYAFGRVSGGHFNPAVSVGAALGGRIAWAQAALYMAAQVVGAVVGAAILFVLLQGFDGFSHGDSMGQNGFGDHSPGDYAVWAAFLLELVLTAIFVTVILAVTDTRNEHPALAPLAIGLTLAVVHFVALNATGTSVNPARSIGPALFVDGDAIVQLWLFILAPLAGGALAGIGYPLLFGHGTTPVPGSGMAFGRSASTGAVPGYGATDQFQQEWNQQAPVGAQPAAAQPDAYQQQWTPSGGDQVAAQPVAADPVAQAVAPTPVAQDRPPIIQDGWQWDYDAQEWKPAAQAAPAPGPGTPGSTQGWPATPDDGRTQIRPGDGQ